MATSLQGHHLINLDWPAPESVCGFITTRYGGVSLPPYDSFNVATHVGDDVNHIAINKRRLERYLGLPVSYPQQIHGDDILHLHHKHKAQLPFLINASADAVYTQSKQHPCAIQTADCLPVFLCNKAGTEVCVVHAGWRSLAKGLVTKSIKHFVSAPSDMLIYLGPAISQAHFEVGSEVVDAFKHLAQTHGWARTFNQVVISKKNRKYHLDLYKLARLECIASGVKSSDIYGGNYCTYSEPSRFFSYRREGQCGRMLNLIWLAS